MDVFAYANFTAILALLAIALGVTGVVAGLTVKPGTRAGMADLGRWLAWLVAAACMAGSLIYSGIYDFEPCVFCWYQRIAMYPLAAVLLVGALRREASIRFYGLPLSLVGLATSLWHVLVQNVISLQGSGSCDPDNPCFLKYVNVFDFVSIPVMAAAGFFLISVLLAFFSSPMSEAQ